MVLHLSSIVFVFRDLEVGGFVVQPLLSYYSYVRRGLDQPPSRRSRQAPLAGSLKREENYLFRNNTSEKKDSKLPRLEPQAKLEPLLIYLLHNPQHVDKQCTIALPRPLFVNVF